MLNIILFYFTHTVFVDQVSGSSLAGWFWLRVSCEVAARMSAGAGGSSEGLIGAGGSSEGLTGAGGSSEGLTGAGGSVSKMAPSHL